MKYLYYLCTALGKCARKGRLAPFENKRNFNLKY
jgi:hypothetical protein